MTMEYTALWNREEKRWRRSSVAVRIKRASGQASQGPAPRVDCKSVHECS